MAMNLSAGAWRGIKFAQDSFAGPLVRRLFGRADPEKVAARLYRSDATLEAVTVSAADPEAAARASTILHDEGVVVLKDVLDPATVRVALAEADAIVGQINGLDPEATSGELLGAHWQTDSAVLHGYGEIVGHHRPVINIRSRSDDKPDGGMIDIFHLERLITAEQPALQALVRAISDGVVANVMARVSRWPQRQFNLYRNDSVSNPRTLHVDNLRATYKVFAYLSDVRSEADGPYMFMPGTHRRLGLLRKMLYLNHLRGILVTNMPASVAKPLKFVGKAGTIVISCQTGVHGGCPQAPGASRTVLVGSYH